MTRIRQTTRQAILNPAAAQKNFTADQGPPTPSVTTDAHVFPVVPVGSNDEVDFVWQIKARFTATAGDSAAVVILHCYDADEGEWFKTAAMDVNDVPTPLIGNVLTLDGVLGSTHCAFEISGLADGDNLQIIMRPA